MTLPPGWAPRQPEHRPGVLPLRPLGVDDLFTGTFATLRSHWRPLLAVSGPVAAVLAVASIPLLLAARPAGRAFVALATLDPNASNSEATAALGDLVDALFALAPMLLVLFLLQSVAAAVIEAGTAMVVGRAAVGQPVHSQEILRQLLRLLPRLALLGLVMGATIGLGLFLCIIPGLLMWFLWFAAPSIATLEESSAFTALRRSAQLAGKSFWRIVGLLLLVQVVYGLVFQVVSVPISILTSLGAFGAASESIPSGGAITLMLLGYYLMASLALLSYPLIACARTIEYLDLRMRHEDLAPALIAASEQNRESGREQ